MSNSTAVLKHGSSSVENYNGIGMNQAKVNFHVVQHLRLRESGLLTVEVSSGASVEGEEYLQELDDETEEIDNVELAQHGTARQIRHWEKAAAPHNIAVLQALITNQGFDSSERELIIPGVRKAAENSKKLVVINENPFAAIEETEKLQATKESEEQGEDDVEPDNDWLAAHSAIEIGASILLLLSNVHGLKVDGEIKREVRVEEIAEMIQHCNGSSESGKGGMKSKLMAAGRAAEEGVHVIIGHAFTDVRQLTEGHAGTRVIR